MASYVFLLSTKIITERIMHDIPVVPNFAIDGVWINYLIDVGERFSESISVSSVDGKGHLSEIIGHSTSVSNQMLWQLTQHGYDVKTCSGIGRKETCGVPNLRLSKMSCS